jgi:hypothetical protein
MAGSATPYGFKPVGTLTGPYNGQFRKYKIAASSAAIYQGDVVKCVNDGTVTVDTGTTTAKPLGIFMGCEFTNPTTNQFVQSAYWPNNAATDAYAFVADNPFLVMQVQAAGPLTQTHCFNNVAISTYVAGSSTFGISRVTVGTTPATTGTLPVRIIGFVNGPDSVIGDAFTDVLVCWNLIAQTTFDGTTGHALFSAVGI